MILCVILTSADDGMTDEVEHNIVLSEEASEMGGTNSDGDSDIEVLPTHNPIQRHRRPRRR